jgi:hypothetical protein
MDRENADTLLSHVKRVLRDWSDETPSRVVSIATDTCATMNSLMEKLQADPDFTHVIWAPCDSHGLQLFLKDILEPSKTRPEIGHLPQTWKETQAIATTFSRSPILLAYLHEQQASENRGATWKIAIGCITRWGSHPATASGVLKSRSALEAFASDPRVIGLLADVDDDDNDAACPDANRDRRNRSEADSSNPEPLDPSNPDKAKRKQVKKLLKVALDSVRNPDYWNRLHWLNEVIQPIHVAQVQSEGVNCHLGEVLPRWRGILEAWRSKPALKSSRSDLFHQLRTAWDYRLHKQLTNDHFLAYSLHPMHAQDHLQPLVGLDKDEEEDLARLNVKIATIAKAEIEKRLKAMGFADEMASLCARRKFHDFRNRTGAFHPGSRPGDIWGGDSRDAIDFWQTAMSLCRPLAELALKLFSIPSSSCPSERSFSAMNWIQGNRRTRLTFARANKLIFSFFNAKLLRAYASDIPVVCFSLLNLPEKELEGIGRAAFEDALRAELESTEISTLLAEGEDLQTSQVVNASERTTQATQSACTASTASTPAQRKTVATANLRLIAIKARAGMYIKENTPNLSVQLIEEVGAMRERIASVTRRLSQSSRDSEIPESHIQRLETVRVSRQTPERPVNVFGHPVETQTQSLTQESIIPAIQTQEHIQPTEPAELNLSRPLEITDHSEMPEIIDKSPPDGSPATKSTNEVLREISGNGKRKRVLTEKGAGLESQRILKRKKTSNAQ